MSGLTEFQADVLRARALVEVAEGRTDGQGLQFVRNYLAMVDAGQLQDPSVPRSPVVKPLKRIDPRPLTNDVLDGRECVRPTGPTVGSRGWFAARKRARAA
jgi:hypothetical protein